MAQVVFFSADAGHGLPYENGTLENAFVRLVQNSTCLGRDDKIRLFIHSPSKSRPRQKTS